MPHCGGGVCRFPSLLKLIFRINLISIIRGGGGFGPKMDVFHHFLFEGFPNLKTHSYTHTGEKPFQCGSCDYSCTTADALKKHSYTHTGEKPYQCSSCAHCPPQTILEKRGALQKNFWATFGMRFCSSNSLLKLKNNALFTWLNLFL